MGKVDAVGRPRSFAYVTLNTNVGKLSRCMNVLSGSTWKGAKIRIAEAKPDYQERLRAERETAASTVDAKPKRKRQRLDGVHAKDMSLVTPSSAAQKSGWKVTEMGRVLRTIRVRPDHPLPLTLEEMAKAKSAVAAGAGTHYTKGKKNEKGREGKGKDGEERKKRKKDPMVRARRVTIDVTKWESTLLKGMFLESQGVGKVESGKEADIRPEGESRRERRRGE
ncbi:hypothetical protein FA13DRAFT_1523424 [Coprinellus micaceus]|uniref:Uncharacterized protein n=1 Tax=Coprinellus micaceus TaxID=71717 RepID=A0A4Y7SJN6_COPMI|nr:hypothetical protein FA13DRAFT_1523424 [Coprinellus micaceus]